MAGVAGVAEGVDFLHALAQALAVVALYPPGHATRLRALDSTYQKLVDLFAVNERPVFSFLGDEVVLGNRPLRELRDWEWSSRLAGIGMQRLEFDSNIAISVEELDALLDHIIARLTLRPTDSSVARQERVTGIRFGAVGVGDEGAPAGAPEGAPEDALEEEPENEEVATATAAYSLEEEAEAVVWVHDVLRDGGELPLMEAEAVVRSLTVAMHGDRQMMLPLLQLRQFDEYTTTHSLNVSVLSMGLAEWLGLGGRDVRAVGVAGLLHDLGKVTIPKEILNKPGRFDDREREIMNTHPVEGARMILTSDQQLDLAAAVAYEHHIMIDGGGYPSMRYPRDCHFASKLVHVCDVYDALRTKRPYRDAVRAKKVLAYIGQKAGTEFDGALAHSFMAMMGQWEPRISTLHGEETPPVGQPSPALTGPDAVTPDGPPE